MASVLNHLNDAAIPTAAQNITENTTCLVLRFGSIAVERKVAKGKIKQRGKDDELMEDAPVEVDADKDLLRVTKKLIESKEFDAIGKDRRAFTRWLRTICVPSLFKEGIYRVSFKAVPKVSEKLKELIAKDQENVEKFLPVYRERCDETKAKLGGLGEDMDYPPLAKVQNAFFIDYHWMTFSTDEKLKQEVSEQFFLEAKAHTEGKMQQATDAIVLMMRQELQAMVDHLVDVLGPNDDGTKKKFHSSTVTKIKEFLDNFQLRNVTNDAQLDIIVQSAKALLDGVSVEDIKKNEAAHDNTLNGMNMVKQCLDQLVVQAGTRKIILQPAPEPPAAPAAAASELDDIFAEVQ